MLQRQRRTTRLVLSWFLVIVGVERSPPDEEDSGTSCQCQPNVKATFGFKGFRESRGTLMFNTLSVTIMGVSLMKIDSLIEQ